MAVFKCKMCAGSLEIAVGANIATCEYCGITQTLPKLNDDRRATLYDRAGHFRRSNEYDKAMAMYETILNEDNTDAEAYWSVVLCRYGVEYVEDPITRKRVPTCNRTQFTSIFADEDYKKAIEMGGHVRVGYEDGPFLSDGRRAASNAELVEDVVRLARKMGRKIASAERAREIIGL